MNILIFIGVLVVLILVHEAGHFFVAKLTGMRVDEFGLGYPPRLAGKKLGETEYTINALPFGGFVRIFGEDSSVVETDIIDGSVSGSFTSKSRLAQGAVLIAGITMNLIFAWVLLTSALLVGTPRALAPGEVASAHNVSLAVGEVIPNSPATRAGIVPGDFIVSASNASSAWHGSDPKTFTAFIANDAGAPLTISVIRNGKEKTLTATPKKGIVSYDAGRYAIGVGISTVGTLPLSFINAVKQGTAITWELTRSTAVGLANFFSRAATFSANLSQVSGPVGIASAIGSAANQGIGNLFSLAALISINLALINLIPIPALDGGRLLFVLIEAVSRRSIKPRVAQIVNTIGFAFIIILMVVVTAHDILVLVG